MTTEADAARDELQTAKTAAATRQRELREKITAEDKARRDQEQSIANAQADAAHAQSIIEQRPKCTTTQRSLSRLQDPGPRQAEHAETEREVAQLEPPRTRCANVPATHASNSPAPSSASSPQSWRSS